jgi:hypothetical protein
MGRIILSALLVASAATGAARAELIYGISVPGATTNLVFFDSATPQNFTTVGAISGIVPGQTLRGIDFRPSNGQLYAMSTNSNGLSAQLYTVNLNTAVATPVGAGITLNANTSPALSIDFNPVPDALRVVTGSGRSYRVNPNTGALIATDSGPALQISGIAYTNNNFGATQTTLYAYDFLRDLLGTIGGINGVPSPNLGQFFAVGPTGVATTDLNLGFDISGLTGIGYVSADDLLGSSSTRAEFFRINLATGTLTQIGPDDLASNLLDISVRPRAVPEPVSIAVFGGLLAVGGLVARRQRRRQD